MSVPFGSSDLALSKSPWDAGVYVISNHHTKMFGYTLVINASKNRFAASHIVVKTKASQMLRTKRPGPTGKSGKVDDLGILYIKTS